MSSDRKRLDKGADDRSSDEDTKSEETRSRTSSSTSETATKVAADAVSVNTETNTNITTVTQKSTQEIPADRPPVLQPQPPPRQQQPHTGISATNQPVQVNTASVQQRTVQAGAGYYNGIEISKNKLV